MIINLDIKDLKIVEFGAAFGHVSIHFASKAQEVVCCEGNVENFNVIKKRVKNIKNLNPKTTQ